MLLEKINQDVKNAIKEGDVFCVGVLRMMIAVFKNKEIEKRGKGENPKLSDEEIVEILFKEIKKRKEAVQIYSNAGRKDLTDKELKEISIIQNYLPVQAGSEEIEKIVMEAIEATGAFSQKDFSRVMAAAAKKLKGRAESALIVELIKKKLGNE
ncbi:MAG: GatB/YqeY domain-containing protein [Patescibacteria group bacterium]